MKKDNIIITCLFIIILLIICFIYFNINKGKNKKFDSKFKAVFLTDVYEQLFDDDYIIFKDYDSFHKVFEESNINKNDFVKYNYLVFGFNYDSCTESKFEPTITSYENNILNVTITYDVICGVCKPAYMYYYIKINKDEVIDNFKYTSKANNSLDCDPMIAYKPMIYLYPKKDTWIDVRLGNSDLLTTTYPKYNNHWYVFANTNGILKDENNRYYYGLYWEGKNHVAKVHDDGFVVKGEDTIFFLEEKLKLLGLNDFEANEFIVYWLPKLEKNKYNYIRFETNEEINNYMPLDINPKPDTTIRILMDYKPLEYKINVKEQKLNTISRIGFTVVEWGGSLIEG